MPITLDDLRRFAVDRSLFPATTLKRALDYWGFVQADPIRAPARAQDLMLRHRVKGYRVGDLERRYAEIGVEEDFFVNYGFVTKALHALMHPRAMVGVPAAGIQPWSAAQKRKARLLLEFVQERGPVHPREVDAHFSHGKVQNAWGGSSNATTHLLDAMHYRGMLRIVRRENGIRIYGVHQHKPGPSDAESRRIQIDTLADAAIRIYAPLPGKTLSFLLRRLRYAVPQWRDEIPGALKRAKSRLAHVRIDGIDWYWPSEEDPGCAAVQDTVRLLTPFDPIVWDRDRFELLWNWIYRFEAYTPPAKRKFGYYALPLLWRDRVIGWGNLSVKDSKLIPEIGYIARPPRERLFKNELEAEIDRIQAFLGL